MDIENYPHPSEEDSKRIYDAYANYIQKNFENEDALKNSAYEKGATKKLLGLCSNELALWDSIEDKDLGINIGFWSCYLNIYSMRIVHLLDDSFVTSVDFNNADELIDYINQMSFEVLYNDFLSTFENILSNYTKQKEAELDDKKDEKN